MNQRADNPTANRKMNKRSNNDLQSTTQNTKDWPTRFPQRVRSSCSASSTRRVALVKSPDISQEWGKYNIVTKIYGFVTKIFRKGRPSHGGDCKPYQKSHMKTLYQTMDLTGLKYSKSRMFVLLSNFWYLFHSKII